MNSPTVLVTGATGTIGSSLIPALVERGVAVRAMTRTAGAPIAGADTVVADLGDPEAVTAALTGADAVFLNSPSAPDAAALQIQFAELARKAGVNRLVLLSQYAARIDSPVRFLRWHAEVEAHVRTLDFDFTVLRPNLFMQGLLSFAGTVAQQGRFGAPIGGAAVSLIDASDIAAAAAAVLTRTGHTGGVYTLTGPRAITHEEIAEALATATGRDIAFDDVPAERFAAALSPYLPPWQLDGLVEDYAHYARGEAAEVHPDAADLIGRPARDITDFARDHAAAFGAA
ncbi:MAG: NmrA family NAD(P)-binding protein [Stackebrandtia sp.]